MKFMPRSLLALGVAATAVAAFASGCADNNATLFVRSVIAPKPPDCNYSPDPSGTFFGSGALDVAFQTTYLAGLLVGNQYTPRGDKDNLRTETTRVNLTGAEVRLTNSDGSSYKCPSDKKGCNHFSVYGSGFVDSNKGADPGYGAFLAELIPDSVGEDLLGQLEGNVTATKEIIAHVSVFGQTTGGQDIDSGELTFPIKVCWGCLVAFPLDAIDPAQADTCKAEADKVGVGSCIQGQDALVDCRACVSDHPDVCERPLN